MDTQYNVGDVLLLTYNTWTNSYKMVIQPTAQLVTVLCTEGKMRVRYPTGRETTILELSSVRRIYNLTRTNAALLNI